MSQVFEAKSPTRVDLAGGTLDLWPLYSFLGGATTVNVAIDIFTTARLEILPDTSQIIIESEDIQLHKVYSSFAQAVGDTDPQLTLYRLQLQFWKPQFGFKLTTKSESPVGGGLGGSSSLLISLLKVFSKACLRPFPSVHSMVDLAHNLEAEQLMTPTGTQDYYPAVSGGINILEYKHTGVSQEVFTDEKNQEFADRFLLVYTGRSHHSGMNNFEVMQNAVAKKRETIHALVTIKQVAIEMAAQVRVGQWNQMTPLFHREYDARTKLAAAVLSPEIIKLHDLALGADAEAIKICGAGGGGCVMVWCSPRHDNKNKVAKLCQESGFRVLNAHPVWSVPSYK